MSARLVGTFTPKLDDKGRLTLPAKFRDALAGGVMVTKGQDRCLAVYGMEEFDRIAARIQEASRNDPEARSYARLFYASVSDQRPDGQGRIPLSADHRDYAGLTKECVVTGQFDHLEIWNAEAWHEYQTAGLDSFSSAGSAALDSML